MKFYKTLNLYKASNVSFDPRAQVARSYNWWVFVARIDGKLVFNNFPYSNSTIKHQSKVRRLLAEQGVEIDAEISTRASLGVGLEAIEQGLQNIRNEITALEDAIRKPRSQKAKNLERAKRIGELEASLKLLAKQFKLKAPARPVETPTPGVERPALYLVRA